MMGPNTIAHPGRSSSQIRPKSCPAAGSHEEVIEGFLNRLSATAEISSKIRACFAVIEGSKPISPPEKSLMDSGQWQAPPFDKL